MKSKERVRNAIDLKPVDRVPAALEATGYVWERLKERYGYDDQEQVYQHFEIDIRPVGPKYIGPEFKRTALDGKDFETESLWGNRIKHVWNGTEYNTVTSYHPLNDAETPADVDAFEFPPMEYFDFESIKGQCAQYEDYALIFGHWGPFQTATDLRSEDKLYMDLALNPELTARIFGRMHDWEMEFYERIFQAGDGQIDILRVHDDYGSQQNMLFSLEMWEQFFEKNTRELADLAHRYGAVYQQHSCGAVRPVIPKLIECGIDVLEPVQPVEGMDPEGLARDFKGKLCFQGGIDTQHLLPFGSREDVQNEVRRYITCLNDPGGYILFPSQSWESVVPLDNLEALYSVRN